MSGEVIDLTLDSGSDLETDNSSLFTQCEKTEVLSDVEIFSEIESQSVCSGTGPDGSENSLSGSFPGQADQADSVDVSPLSNFGNSFVDSDDECTL